MIVFAELETAYENITILCLLNTTWALLLGKEEDKILFIIRKYNSYIACLKKTNNRYMFQEQILVNYL